ncbi:amidase [Rhodobacteraceae bacterium CCMM004]|nr:amidase [Rhodobacteraceae bacterium CCMM004]
MDAWRWMTAAELGRGIGAGEIDPVALTRTYLDAMEADALTPRIYARDTQARALEEASAAAERAAAGRRRGPLDGVPISWKDLFDSAGVATESGSALLRGRVPDRDAEVLARATAAGLVCLGKTHQTELAFSGLGLNPSTATPPCVNDAAAVAGGSSSGAATSVAFGLAAMGIGSDTGGSVRVPAAWNDLVGLKTTHGRVSLAGVVPLCPRFDTVGPLCRSVEDTALMLSVLDGRPAPDLTGATLEGARLLVLQGTAQDDLARAVSTGVQSAVERLQAAGAVIDRAESAAVEEALPMSAILFTAEAWGVWGDVIEAQPDVMFAPVRDRFMSGRDYLAADYVRAWRRLDALRADYLAQTEGFDAVLVPTCPILPPDAQRLLDDSEYFRVKNLLALRNTRIGNVMGLAALTLPTGVPSVGLTLQTAPMQEARLLRLGAAAEAALA